MTPEPKQIWREKSTGSIYTVSDIARWNYQSQIIHCVIYRATVTRGVPINASLSLYVMPVDQFQSEFTPVSDTEVFESIHP